MAKKVTKKITKVKPTKLPGNKAKKNKTSFTSESLKGNSNAKKDFTREAARNVVWDELKHASKMIAEVPVSSLKKMIERGELENESLITYTAVKKAVKGDYKPVIWICEMVVGKALQQVETTITEHSIGITISKDDSEL